ncbi:MAG: 4-hydroxy-3-methylbut-2-enyl diphosphate reductase [Candidatus Omnitrophica bacterium]|nr:4-hydroxy-3-methylbut-2-enyl diphosphate reductase [Candidatus Omnitrophota bacterium]
MEIYLAHTQGFCAGVARAIEIVDKVLEKYGTPLFIFHEIVHNKSVVDNFEKKGVKFVDSLDEVPDNSRIIFSAHGVSPNITNIAEKKKMHVIDATCPLVERIHRRAFKLSQDGIHVVLIGHQKHEEILGTEGYVDPKLLHIVKNYEDVEGLKIGVHEKISFVTQTTLSLDDTRSIISALKTKYPNLIVPTASDICYATQNRQDAVKDLCKICDIIIVCGSPNSSNSQRLKEAAERHDVKCILIDHADELDIVSLKGYERIGISSGASVPQYIVERVVEKIKKIFLVKKIYVSKSPEQKIKFALPKI